MLFGQENILHKNLSTNFEIKYLKRYKATLKLILSLGIIKSHNFLSKKVQYFRHCTLQISSFLFMYIDKTNMYYLLKCHLIMDGLRSRELIKGLMNIFFFKEI